MKPTRIGQGHSSVSVAAHISANRQVRLESRAKAAYDAWSNATGAERSLRYPPFCRLPPSFIEGWKAVVEALDTEPTCWECGAALTCEKCKEQTK